MKIKPLKFFAFILIGLIGVYFLIPSSTPISDESEPSITNSSEPSRQAQTPPPIVKPKKAKPVVLSPKAKRAIALAAKASDLDPRVLELALTAHEEAKAKGLISKPLLTVIDYSKRSVEKRLWVFDLAKNELILETHVTHGEKSGKDRPIRFSNVEDSHQTSIGVFTTAEAYHGMYGYSLRLDGRERGINDKARKRAIVMHGADYATEQYIEKNGVLGTSWACPAVDDEIAEYLIEIIKEGSLIFAYYPDSDWLQNSKFLNHWE